MFLHEIKQRLLVYNVQQRVVALNPHVRSDFLYASLQILQKRRMCGVWYGMVLRHLARTTRPKCWLRHTERQ